MVDKCKPKPKKAPYICAGNFKTPNKVRVGPVCEAKKNQKSIPYTPPHSRGNQKKKG
jgi:hypothetical protein